MSVKLIIGLGNPGSDYANTRHNIGFRCVNHFAKAHGISVDTLNSKAKVGRGKVEGQGVVLAKPRTYMNASGKSVLLLVKKYEVPLEDLVVIHDDLDLPLGKIRLRPGGGSGGHKGLDSIISCLGTQEFPRMRVGIDRPLEAREEDIVQYVLGAFEPEERETITQTIPKVTGVLNCFLAEGIVSAMNKYN